MGTEEDQLVELNVRGRVAATRNQSTALGGVAHAEVIEGKEEVE
jgi:hypothetical protein